MEVRTGWRRAGKGRDLRGETAFASFLPELVDGFVLPGLCEENGGDKRPRVRDDGGPELGGDGRAKHDEQQVSARKGRRRNALGRSTSRRLFPVYEIMSTWPGGPVTAPRAVDARVGSFVRSRARRLGRERGQRGGAGRRAKRDAVEN